MSLIRRLKISKFREEELDINDRDIINYIEDIFSKIELRKDNNYGLFYGINNLIYFQDYNNVIFLSYGFWNSISKRYGVDNKENYLIFEYYLKIFLKKEINTIKIVYRSHFRTIEKELNYEFSKKIEN